MSGDRDPTWALLAPVPPATLRRAIAEGPPGARWRVVEGSGAYHALVDDEPGTEHSGERELAERLSMNGRCYVLYFDEAWVSACERGRWVEEAECPVHALARELECPLRAELAPIEHVALCFLVVLDAEPRRVAEAFRPGPPPRVERVPLGALAWDKDGDVVDYGLRVSAKLSATVYTVEWDPDRPQFRCERIEDGEVTGHYDDPPSWWSEEKRMSDVLGEREPNRIVARLGFAAVRR